MRKNLRRNITYSRRIIIYKDSLDINQYMFDVHERTSELVCYISCHGLLVDNKEKAITVVIILNSDVVS